VLPLPAIVWRIYVEEAELNEAVREFCRAHPAAPT
jgi:hypothetical protein